MSKAVICPACSSPMKTENFGAIYVDVCVEGCKGIWFDEGELQRLDHQRKGMGPHLERALREESIEPVELESEPMSCPRCGDTMDEIEYELEPSVRIDACEGCGGIYLDVGELRRIRQRSLTPEEESDAATFRRRLRRRRRRREADRAVSDGVASQIAMLWML